MARSRLQRESLKRSVRSASILRARATSPPPGSTSLRHLPRVQPPQPWTRLLILAGLVQNPANLTPEDRVLDKFSERLRVFPVRGSRVINVEFTSADSDGTDVTQTFRVLAAWLKEDTGWRIVQTQWSNAK